MIDLVFGAGQGGARIAQQLATVFKCEARYLNLATVDFLRMGIAPSHRFVLERGGSGRDPIVAEKIVRSRVDDLTVFVHDALKVSEAKNVAICVGGGGGSGAGYLFSLIEILQHYRIKNILLLYTLPLKSEGLPAKPNALLTLNRIISKYVGKEIKKDKQVAPILIDNEFCLQRYGEGKSGAGYWSSVNMGIVSALYRFYILTDLKSYKNFANMAAGFNSLDYREFMRIFFFKNGFVDIREVSVDLQSDIKDLGKKLKTSSLVFGSFDLRTSKAYIASLALPVTWLNRATNINEITNEIFAAVAKRAKTPYSLKSSYYSSAITEAKLSLLVVGLSKSHGLEKILRQTEKDVARFKEKGDVELLDLSLLEY